ncbi:Pycsar system effector family protein [Kitasatospora sp. NPDC059648]|uniref:Pycsar system effector family protein n=1 Tax=Kitasatospora sp. NPDC059648 TaxID=3346894 RepID=UPI0036854E0A
MSASPTTPAPTSTLPAPPPGAALLAELRTEIARADSKAAVLVAALGVIVGVLGGLLTSTGWAPQQLSGAAKVLLALGGLGLTVSLVALLFAVLPRFRRSSWRPGRPLGYFGDIRLAAEQGLLADALADTERLAAEAVHAALAENSLIVSRKHSWVRVGVLAFGAGLFPLVTALFLG